MPRQTTFGFEAEWQVNAQGVLARLYDMELAGDRTLHGYHCDCEDCEFHNGYAFRGQTDSSCSGEIITDILGGFDSEYNVPYLYESLSIAALDADAEPGLNSAFHVHVGIGDLELEELADALYQFVRWEPVLSRVAGGRWAAQREGMNRTVRADIIPEWHRYISDDNVSTRALIAHERDYGVGDDFKQAILRRSNCSDRHSNLNTQARRAPTWEFRLWNSTRSAWRMEMFVGLSVALTDPEVIGNLADLTPPERLRRPSTGIDSIIAALETEDGGYARLAGHVARQSSYLDNRAGDAPAVLTAL